MEVRQGAKDRHRQASPRRTWDGFYYKRDGSHGRGVFQEMTQSELYV